MVEHLQNASLREMIMALVKDTCGLAVLMGVIAAVNMWSGLLAF
jgi:hypothetical protein